MVTSGPASPSFSFSNKGNNINACPSDQQIAQTGNVANEQGAIPFESKIDGVFGDIIGGLGASEGTGRGIDYETGYETRE